MPQKRINDNDARSRAKALRKGSRAHREDEIDEALKQSFPASDPPSYTTPHRPEGPQSDGTLDNDKVGTAKKPKP